MGPLSTLETTTRVASVERARLLTRLHDDAEVPVVVVHAPAGFGKTTLAEQWAHHDFRPHSTLRIASPDNDPAALALALIGALEPIGPSVGRIRSVATSVEPSFSALLLPAITRLASSRRDPFVLVVDDVHLLTRPACHAVLEAVVRGLPVGSQLALLSRQGPPPWLARARAEGRLVCLGPDDLAFGDGESHNLLDGLGMALPPELAADLVARAEGWPVALYLMALAVDAHGARSLPAGVTGTASDPFVRDYLKSEVLAGLDDGTRAFLRRTSVLEELSGPSCDALLQRRDSAAVLAHLTGRLQLVVATEPPPGRYRYHHLLADALHAELESSEPWSAPELHRRASAWHESQGDLAAAIRHAKAAGDLELTGRLVWSGVPACISSGQPDRLAAWLADLDDLRIRSDRWLSLAAAWLGLQSGDPTRMTRWLLAAEEHAGAAWEERVPDDEYAASLACLHVVVGDRGVEGSLALCVGAERGLPRDSGFRAAALHNQGVALTLLRRFQEGLDSLRRAELLGRALGVPIIEANALAWQGMLALLNDDWAEGVPLIERAGELVEAHHLERLATSVNTITALALLKAARGDKDEARVVLGTARRLTTRVSQIAPWFAIAGPLVQARAAILLGDPALARTLCGEARHHVTPDLADTLLLELLDDAEARLRSLQDDQLGSESLTTAQLRVLQFLPSRLTFDEIGEHLFLSRATIKSHASAIYRKLGASSRDEAISRARTLGLVESPPAD
jgi:LuxR family transcriptional regulator, maltose regulon positive regulatory protein